ncbi:MAG TPA: VTT domain-containing protein [Vicinamibacterales bacterium]|nr:VTT domain-containing protein [Vicinamibacterales bacterium]
MLTWLGIVLGTFVSEDATCIATGLLIQRGEIGLTSGILACLAGIYLGDLGLWGAGRLFGGTAVRWQWAARRLSHAAVHDARACLDRHAAGAIVASRFLPGTRFVLYVTAGVLGLPGVVFATWSFIAAVLWTPTLVLFSASLGDAFAVRASPIVSSPWSSRVAAALVVFVSLQALRAAADAPTRRRIAARIARWCRWEFWPTWLFYLPVIPYILWLALRYRGMSTITAANPGMPDGGIVGESKFDILRRLPSPWTVPSALVEKGTVDDRLHRLQDECAARGWSLPLILKPDVGQRGAGVRLVATWNAAAEYLAAVDAAVIAQPYHPGPYEAGIFYYRLPGSPRGRIFSITDKRFPVLVGDGVATLETLIWSHPRFRLQAATFAARHSARLNHVLAAGERFPLAVAGNHCQGTLFCAGRHLLTPALEQRVDEIARAYPGFFVGRFDVRYSDVAAFKDGRDLAIVELNGVTSESTDIYDPDGTLLRAYRQLFRQWSIVFAIGAANRAAGAPVSSARRLSALVHAHLTTPVAVPISD